MRGKCRHCGERIPLRYPLVELATAAAFALCVAKLGLTWPAAKFAVLSAILIALIATDLEERILPDEFTLGGTVLGIALSGLVPLDPGIASFSGVGRGRPALVVGGGVGTGALLVRD